VKLDTASEEEFVSVSEDELIKYGQDVDRDVAADEVIRSHESHHTPRGTCYRSEVY